jgi:ketosteroid isomerase-like protein
MDQEQVEEAAARFIEYLGRVELAEAGAVDGLAALFAPDAELSNPIMQRERRQLCGRGPIAEFWRQYSTTFGAIHSEFFATTVGDHAAGLFWHSTGSGPHGEPIDYEGATLLLFDGNGKIARFHSYFDTDCVKIPARAH